MSLQDSLMDSMGRFLMREGHDVQKVVGYEEEERSDGYCETCWYEWIVVVIEYVQPDGQQRSYEYYGGFADLIRELTD